MKKIFFVNSLIALAFTSILSVCSAQTSLSLGDIAFISYNSDSSVPAGTPNDQFGFISFIEIEANTIITFTDNGWLNAGGFNVSESTIEVTFSSAINCGEQIYIDADGGVLNQNGTSKGSYSGSPISLVISGDQIFAYQGTAPSDNSIAELSKFLAAIHMNCASCTPSNWDGESTSGTTSAKPSVFITSGPNVNTTYFPIENDNSKYDCSIAGNDPSTIAAAIYSLSNWDIDNSSGFAIEDCDFTCAVVPVKLIRFQGNSSNGTNYLNWETASEINNQGFEIQSSKDGIRFEKIGFVKSYENPTSQNSYEFRHNTSNNKEHYYRLKQIDYDGIYEYSPIVRIQGILNNLSIYPTLASNVIHITSKSNFNSDDSFEIYSNLGNILIKKSVSEYQSQDNFEIDISELKPGIYYLIQENKHMEPIKFIKM